MAIKTYGYMRYSRDKQQDQRQRHTISEFCKKKGWGVLTDAFVDRATSGKAKFLERADAIRMVSILKPGDRIIVASLDRLGRTIMDLISTLELLVKQHKVHVYIVDNSPTKDDPISLEDPMAMMFLFCLAFVADMEWKLASTRNREAREARKAAGMFSGGQVAFGYKKQGKRIVIDPMQMSALQSASNLITRGYVSSIDGAARALLDAGIHYFDSKGRTRSWSASRLKRCIDRWASGSFVEHIGPCPEVVRDTRRLPRVPKDYRWFTPAAKRKYKATATLRQMERATRREAAEAAKGGLQQ